MLAAALAAAAGCANFARAASPPLPADQSSVAQYVETIPSSGGAAAVGASVSAPTHLSDRASRVLVLKGGAETGLLQRITSSTYLGAPQTSLRDRGDTRAPSLSGSGVVRLVIMLALVTATVAVGGAGRRLARRRPPGPSRLGTG
jgi:hypothetical protein